MKNQQLQAKLEQGQGRIQFNQNTPTIPQYGRLVYDYTYPMWISTAVINPQSNCPKRHRKHNQVDILDWTLEIKEVSLLLNLEAEEKSLSETKLPYDIQREECQPTPLSKAIIVWEPQTHCQLFELIRFDAFMVK